MSDEEVNFKDDNEVVTEKHKNLLKNVAKLDKNILRVRKPEKSEPTLEISEFHLVKNGIADKNVVDVAQLIKAIDNKSTKHLNVNLHNKAKNTLPKPLEKAASSRIKREVGFQNVKENFKKWDTIINKNRVAENLRFPFEKKVTKLDFADEASDRKKVQSELEQELEALQPKVVEEKKTKDEFPLTLGEILMKSRELAKLRVQQRYEGGKAYRQKKIKSKTYHKLKKREKSKHQLKKFEELQKSDPEAALEMLEQLDKIRATERMTLKHRNNGLWAKHMQARAQYDKKSCQQLQERLSLSRQLLKKVRRDDDDDDEEDEKTDDNQNAELNSTDNLASEVDNPWINGENQSIDDRLLSQYRNQLNSAVENKSYEKPSVEIENDTNGNSLISENSRNRKAKNKNTKVNQINNGNNNNINNNIKNNDKIKKNQLQLNASKNNEKGKIVETNAGTTNWSIDILANDDEQSSIIPPKKSPIESINSLFDKIENKNSKKNKKKLTKSKLKNSKSIKKGNLSNGVDNLDAEERVQNEPLMKKKCLRPEMIDSLDEVTTDVQNANKEKNSTLNSNDLQAIKSSKGVKNNEIDPKNFINAKKKFDVNKKNSIGEINNEIEAFEDIDEHRRSLITEAFTDDNVVEEFTEEKEKENEKMRPKNLDLTLPGWGSWGGKDIKVRPRKRRYIKSFPKDLNRKDENKDNVIIFENDDDKVKEHQVNDLPYPFNSISDFEANMRLSYGRNFVPENAHKRLVQPEYVTKSGRVIEPMDYEILENKKIIK